MTSVTQCLLSLATMATSGILTTLAAVVALAAAGKVGFKPQELPARIIEVADADDDGKTSLHELLDVIHAMYYKSSAEELSLFDADRDGYLTVEEIRSKVADAHWLLDLIDPDRNGKLSLKAVFDFLHAHGVEIADDFVTIENGLHADEQGRIEEEEAIALTFTMFFLHFMDTTMIRFQLRNHAIGRLLMRSDNINEWFEKDAIINGSWAKRRFVDFMERNNVFLDDSEFFGWITPAEIRSTDFDRSNIGWPRADAEGRFTVSQIASFGRRYHLQMNVSLGNAEGFDAEAADLDHDAFLSPSEVRAWLRGSAGVLLEDYFADVMVFGVKHFMNRVAIALERFIEKENES